ncbi:MAG: glycogen/starch synthase [Anaerolineaceae bacterium]
MQTPLRVLFLVAEAAPFIKIGGLGDVGGSLPPALKKAGGDALDIRLAIPHHPGIVLHGKKAKKVGQVMVTTRQGNIPAPIHSLEHEGVIVYLIGGKPVSSSPVVYHGDARLDGLKYTFFSLAALELTRQLGWSPHLLHANDWHASPAIVALATKYKNDSHFVSMRSILTLHNLPYMGDGQSFPDFGLEYASGDRLPEWARGLPLPLGLLLADRIVAVSPTYAREILTDNSGCGLQDFLTNRKRDIQGILNGLDLQIWNPETDALIPQTFTSKSLSLRQKDKTDLLDTLGFVDKPHMPLMGMVSRLDPQKGVDLAFEALRGLDSPDWRFILIGTGDLKLEESARKLQADFPDQVRVVLRYDNGMAHRVYAGADMLLMASRYEPCGLSQLIAMRYGCIPVATRIGGLQDTIVDRPDGSGQTGFLAEQVTADAFTVTVQRALHEYKDVAAWPVLQKRAMRQDYSWSKPAQKYLKLYQSLFFG